MAKSLITALALCLGLVACGQKGPLIYPPAKPEQNQEQSAAPAE